MAETPLCPETGRPMARGVRPLMISYEGRTRMIDMPGWYCEESGESVHTKEDMKVSDLAIVRLKAELQNLASPDEVREIRTRLGMTQAEAGRVLGGGVRAFQKYESGETLTSRAMTNLLRSLVRHPEDVDHIREDVRKSVDQREYA